MSYILEALKKSEEERRLGDSPKITSDHQLLQHNANRSSKFLWLSFGFIMLCIFIILFFINALFFSKTSYPFFNEKLSNGQQQKITQHLNQEIPYKAGYRKSQPNTQSVTQSVTQSIAQSIAQSQATDVQALSGNDFLNSGAEISSEGYEVIRPNKERRAAIQEKIENDKRKDEELASEYQTWFDPNDNVESKQSNKQSELISNSSLKKYANTEQENKSQVDNGAKAPELLTSKETNIGSALDVKDKLGLSESSQNDKPELIPTPVKTWDDYQDIASLSSLLKQQLPLIKVSTHIYSSAASFRKVTVNGISAKQGAEISNGLVLERITEDGVIFSFKGESFRMKALEEWNG